MAVIRHKGEKQTRLLKVIEFLYIFVKFMCIDSTYMLLIFVVFSAVTIKYILLFYESEGVWSANNNLVNSEDFWESAGMYLLFFHLYFIAYWPKIS